MMELLLTTNRVAVGDGGGHCAVDNLNVIEHLCGTHNVGSYIHHYCCC